MARTLFGQGQFSGIITLPGVQIGPQSAIAAMACGIGLIARDRTEASAARTLAAGVNLSPNDPGLAVEALSGGNQQKVVVARWLKTDRKLPICGDPTPGVDVRAKAEIFALLNAAARARGGNHHRLHRFRGGRRDLPARHGYNTPNPTKPNTAYQTMNT